MNSSGMKRGLAISAVSAMTIAGLGLAGPSFADSIRAQQGGVDNVTLYTQSSGQASFKNDGVDTTVHLVAGGGADVSKIQFSYSTDGGSTFTDIGTPVSPGPDGYFHTAWTPPTAVYNLSVKVKAQGIASTSTDIAGATDTSTAVVSSNAESVNLSSTPGSVGVYQQPGGAPNNMLLGVASGKTSDVSGTADVELAAPYGGNSIKADTLGTPAGGSRTFSGLVDFTGYNWTPGVGAVNDAVITATDGSDDATSTSLYQQTIAAVTARVVPTLNQDGKTSTAIITVVDQKGNPVAGAAVFNDATPGVGTQYTDSSGQASFTGLAGSHAPGTSYKFDVDVNGNGSYDATGDFQRTVTVTNYAPALSTLTATAAHTVFDRTETDPANAITITAKDQNGAGIAAVPNLVAKWVTTAFTGAPPAVTTETATLTDNGDGTYTVNHPSNDGTSVLSVWQETDGTPGESSGDLKAADLTVKVGQGTVTWTDGTGGSTGGVVQGAAGSTQTVHGVLALPDGTPLPGRNLGLSWNDSTTQPAVVANNAAQPTGTVRTSDTSADTVTGADGTFGVALIDPTQPAADYVANDEGYVSAYPETTPGLGNDETGWNYLYVDFLANSAPATISTGGHFDTLDGELTPGRPAGLYGIHLRNADGQDLAGRNVTVSVNHGFIAAYDPNSSGPSHLVADPAQTEGGEFGDWKSVGTTETVKTDSSGRVDHLRIAIGKDAGFDATGSVTTTVTLTAGNVTQTVPLTFTSDNPLNLKDLSVSVAPKAQQSPWLTKLPDAATGNSVNLQVRAKDQFGNLTAVPTTLATSGAGSLDDSTVSSGFGTSTQTDAYTNSGASVGDQNVTVTLNESNTPKSVWHDTTPAPATARTWVESSTLNSDFTQAPLVGTPTKVTWYAVNYAASKFTLTHNTPNTVAPGTSVTETYTALDQVGAPIPGMGVNFLRSGPDTLQNGNGSGVGETNNQGQATYLFQGTRPGTAAITAVMGDIGGFPPFFTFSNPITASQVNDTVVFANPAPAKRAIHPTIALSNSGRNDVVTIHAGSLAHGAVVTFYRVTSTGHRVKIGTATLGANGAVSKKFRDRNGRAITKYMAVVAGTARTLSGSTPTRGIR